MPKAHGQYCLTHLPISCNEKKVSLPTGHASRPCLSWRTSRRHWAGMGLASATAEMKHALFALRL